MPKFEFGFKPKNGLPYDLSNAELASLVGAVPVRAAPFEYMGRNGGDIQGLGAGIEPYTFQCFYTGDDYSDRLRNLRAAIQTQPAGQLTHPELGTVPAFCLGIDEYSVNYVTERDTVNFRISFKQDATDQTTAINQISSASSKAAQVSKTLQQVSAAVATVANYVTLVAELPSKINAEVTSLNRTLDAMVNFTNIFCNSSVQMATIGTVDFTLDAQRDNVFAGCQGMITALRGTGLPDASLYPALASVQLTYAQVLDLDSIVRTQAPQVVTVVVQGRQPVVVFAAQQYGGAAAIGKVDELVTNNRIGSFGIPAGKAMRVIAPTGNPAQSA